MKKEDLLKYLDENKLTVKEKIGMILSNRIDYGSPNGAMVSVKNFDNVAEDLIDYFKL